MTSLRVLATTASLLALGACGTHQSVAPVVYGTQPTSTARIYNSKAEYEASRSRQAQVYREPTMQSAPTADVEPVKLKPVSAIYLSDEERARAARRDDRAMAATKASYRVAEASARMVTVRKGDTVYAIGRRFNAAPKDIIAVNNLRAPYHLSVGQRLALPGQQNLAAAPQRNVVSRDALYRVKQGDTLYAISRATGVSVAKLAQANGLRPPYTLSPGQEILAPGASVQAATRVAKATTPKPAPEPKMEKADVEQLTRKASYTPPPSSGSLFAWPVRGNVISQYGVGELGRRNDGINIAAPAGTPVRSAGDGEVVYRGSELDGFGNLLLVKHADGFVTAYAHNDAMLVKKGDVVRKGQVIAKVGQTGSVTTPQLHFEIRQKLKSVDPVTLLGGK